MKDYFAVPDAYPLARPMVESIGQALAKYTGQDAVETNTAKGMACLCYLAWHIACGAPESREKAMAAMPKLLEQLVNANLMHMSPNPPGKAN